MFSKLYKTMLLIAFIILNNGVHSSDVMIDSDESLESSREVSVKYGSSSYFGNLIKYHTHLYNNFNIENYYN